MSFDVWLVFGILATTMVLFVTEKLRVDLVALLVLVTLALTGLVSTSEALSGFASPAVVTVWAVFVLSGGLARTGVAGLIGQQVLRVAGAGELRLTVVIMLVTAAMSAFMNNVGVAAMLLPVVMDIAQRTGRAPSRLLMPLAFGSLLGGLNTLIGTPPNILISDAMAGAGMEPFGMFAFSAVGLPLTLAGILYMALVGRYLLPERNPAREAVADEPDDLDRPYALTERLVVLRVPEGSPLAGLPLAASRLGTALGLNVLAVLRGETRLLAPGQVLRLAAGDRLVASGRLDWLEELRGWQGLGRDDRVPDLERLLTANTVMTELKLPPRSRLVGQTLRQAGFRRRFGLNVLAIGQPGIESARRTDLQDVRLPDGAMLLVYGPPEAVSAAEAAGIASATVLSATQVAERYRLQERLMNLELPAGSQLAGATLAESRLGDAFDLVVLGIERGDKLLPMPAPNARLEAGDALIVEGREEDLELVAGLQALTLEDGPPPRLDQLESDQVGLAEVILSPHTQLTGRTPRDLGWRSKYGLTVLAILRGGRPLRSGLADIPLKLGDALLVYGPRAKMGLLGAEPDFVVLTQSAQELPRSDKAGLAAAIMALALLPVILGWAPIAICAIAGAAAMVLGGCLTMDEAYRYIEWKAVFLIAGLLPLGIAMEQTGAARLLAEVVVAVLAPLGWAAVVGGLFLLTNVMTQIMPNPAVAVLMAPIAIGAAADLGMSPAALMMVIAMAASAAVMSPVGHPANVLVMGPGGYRFSDYLKVGLPLTVILMLVTLAVLPWVWPLYPEP